MRLLAAEFTIIGHQIDYFKIAERRYVSLFKNRKRRIAKSVIRNLAEQTDAHKERAAQF